MWKITKYATVSSFNSHYEKFTLTGEIKCIDDEIPFDLPKGWEWCRLGEVGDWGAGATPLRSNPEFFGGRIPWLKTGELNYDVIFETEEHITEKALQECSLRLCSQGDILIAMYGATIGKLGIAGIELTTNQACCACTPILFYNTFLFYYLMASKQVFVEQGEGGAQPNISRIKLVSHLFPMPPLAEQKRIVAKIEELMPLVERYGKAQSELEALNSNIREQLKKSVLQYAIEGKLVPQCEEDGTAEDLLAEIQAEKQRLYAEGKLKKKDLAHSTIFRGEDNKYFEKKGEKIICIDEEITFEIPKGWRWVRVRDIGEILTGGTPPKDNPSFYGHRYPLYKPSDLEQGDDTRLATDMLSEEGFMHARQLPINSILVTCIGSLGKIGLIKEVGSCNQQINAIIPFNAIIPKFLYLACISKGFQTELQNKASSTTIQIVNKSRFSEILLALPPRGEQQRIIHKIEEVASIMSR